MPHIAVSTVAGMNAGAGMDPNEGDARSQANISSSCPPLFQSTFDAAASPAKTAAGDNSCMQVLPRHRQSAAVAADVMLRNGSPLSGLHKLAVSICARKKSSPSAVVPVGGDKENVSPPVKQHQPKAAGTAVLHEFMYTICMWCDVLLLGCCLSSRSSL